MFFKKALRSIKRAAFGRIVRQIDTDIASIGRVKVSLRLKTEREGPYVVLALIAPGNYQYCPMDIGELDAVIKAMSEIRAAAAELENST
ncbi:hypothetical protein [Mesorhizobium sp.]|uniref:hypothetical protein n=1 Tax=Mesorhizobium sp. TaxID=1871066 RepID=UPI00121B8FE4|nr:hypothetical protein [Mesorhizobium sp.]TIN79748.1 MAG: hypothetical protein E5Y09_04740 [Mesorhizobium sp.]